MTFTVVVISVVDRVVVVGLGGAVGGFGPEDVLDTSVWDVVVSETTTLDVVDSSKQNELTL